MEQVARDRIATFADNFVVAAVLGVGAATAAAAAVAVVSTAAAVAVAVVSTAAVAGAAIAGAAGTAKGRINSKIHKKSALAGKIIGFGLPVAAGLTAAAMVYNHEIMQSRPVESAAPAPETTLAFKGACDNIRILRNPGSTPIVIVPRGCTPR